MHVEEYLIRHSALETAVKATGGMQEQVFRVFSLNINAGTSVPATPIGNRKPQ